MATSQPERPRLLALHGLLSTGRVWEPLAAELEGRVELITPDLPGHGRTPFDLAVFDVDPVVDHLAELVERERPTHLLGHSLGGILALALAAALPGRFPSVAVAGLPVFYNRRDALAYLRPRGPLVRAFVGHDRLAHAGCWLAHRTRRLWLDLAHRKLPLEPRGVLASTFDHRLEAHTGAMEHVILDDRVRHIAPRVEAPVVALHGTRDRAAPLRRVERLAAVHGWDLRLLEGANHEAIVERPLAVAEWLHTRVLGVRREEPRVFAGGR